MEKINILVIGEICIDEFIYCETNRLSPEAPIPVLTPVKTIKNPGMAGNTVANIKALVPDSNIMYLIQDGDITKTRYIEEKSNHMFLRVDEGEKYIKPFKWSLEVDIMLGQADIVIVSDYNKGFLNDLDLKEIALKSKLSILDSKRKLTNDIIENFTFVKLNELERNNNPNLTTKNIITTLGKKGAYYNGELFESPNPQDTIDVSGAGDTFTAAFIIKFYESLEERVAIEFANAKSSEVVSKRGVVVPS
jgi:D-beta-D-heptose 7-phosphate kinase/D-beta-D-heptose 1-phosphate adenosyltransferase